MLIMLIIQPFPLFLHCSIISWMIPFLLFAPELDLWKNWASDSTQTINSDLSYCCSWLFIMMRTMTVRMMMKMMMTRFEWWTYWQAAVLTVWKKLADSHLQFLNSIHTSMAAIVIGAVLFTFKWDLVQKLSQWERHLLITIVNSSTVFTQPWLQW